MCKQLEDLKSCVELLKIFSFKKFPVANLVILVMQ
jgi:hypothetical protein